MKNKYFNQKLILASFSITIIITIILSCVKEDCDYIIADNPISNANCKMTSTLNLSTGIDTNGDLIPPGKGVTDPFWKLLNNPPLISCTSPLVPSINGSAYVVNFSNAGNNGWVNQPTSSTLAPLDLGTTDSFGCNNAINSQGARVPYIFERSFCILKNTAVDFNFSFKGDDQINFELINNNSNTVINTSATYVFPLPGGVPLSWSASGISLTAGSYSLRAYLVNTSSVVTSFSFTGNLKTTNGELALSDNVGGCCENNVISILNILDENCNKTFDGTDSVGNGFTFNLKNSSNIIIKTGVSDANGNVFFSGLANGTYTVSIVPQSGWTPNTPAGGSSIITVNNNQIVNINFYNCH